MEDREFGVETPGDHHQSQVPEGNFYTDTSTLGTHPLTLQDKDDIYLCVPPLVHFMPSSPRMKPQAERNTSKPVPRLPQNSQKKRQY